MVHSCADADDGFKHLQAHVATTAFDSDDGEDAPKCHPNTRQAVLNDIMNWITIETAIRIQWILWLNGAAGAGKSAIGRSIVELCLAQSIPVARFFFFRTDSTRNNVKPVVATLVHQLIESIPELRSIIIPRIQADSLIFTKSLETQFQTLIFAPLRQLQSESSTPPKTVVLLFDGVDECKKYDEQAKLIRTVTDFVKKHAFPMIAFFGSRAENYLCAEFRSPVFSDILLQIPLDTDYRADEDILRFLNDSFATIKSTHPFGSDLRDINWPAQADIDEIIRKGSGQFIYASVVIRFISVADQDPAQLLEIVRGLRPSGNLTPFAQLDALYRHIFSQVTDIQVTSLVLAWEMFAQPIDHMEPLGGGGHRMVFGTMTDAEIKVALAALTSVLTYNRRGDIKFLHASLPDFLLDPKRSRVYYIDRATWSAQLSILTVRRMIYHEPSKIMNREDPLPVPGKLDFISLVESLLPHAKLTADLKEQVAALRPNLHWRKPSFECKTDSDRNKFIEVMAAYIKIIQKWDVGDGASGQIYDEQKKAIICYCREHFRGHPSRIQLLYDLIDEPILVGQEDGWTQSFML